jgi:hypothetical protein
MASPGKSAAGLRLMRWHMDTNGEPRGPAISPLVHSISGWPAKPSHVRQAGAARRARST